MIEIRERPAAGLAIRLHDNDNVLIARSDLAIGTRLEREGLTLKSQVPAGNKIAARAIQKGEPILKYNVVIGFAITIPSIQLLGVLAATIDPAYLCVALAAGPVLGLVALRPLLRSRPSALN